MCRIPYHLYLICVMTLVCSPLLAHQQKEAVTSIVVNPQQQLLQVTHRVYIHDAEHMLKNIDSNQSALNITDILTNEQAQQQLGRYITQQFAIQHQQKNIKLQHLGQEVEGKFLWVYQETTIDKPLNDIRIQHHVFREIWPSQRNLVNIEQAGIRRSIEFSGDDDWLSVTF